MHKVLSLSGLAPAAAIVRSGEQVHCVADRAHVLKYDVEGDENDGSSMAGIQRAVVSLDAAQHRDHECTTLQSGLNPSGDKELCYGKNQNSDCSGAEAKMIPLESGAVECQDCYVSVKADAFYNLNYSMTQLHSAQIGLRNIHATASVSLHKSLSGDKTAFKGSHTFAGSERNLTIIDKLVGCPVCVKVKIEMAVPTALDYELDFHGQTDITAGAKIDAHLADRWAKFDSVAGWSYPDYNRNISVSPILDIDNSKVSADLKVGIRSSVHVNLDNIIWYHLDLNSKLPLSASVAGSIWPFNGKFCLKGDAELGIGHEADLNWNLLTFHAKNHWGPHEDYKWSKNGAVDVCKKLGVSADLVV